MSAAWDDAERDAVRGPSPRTMGSAPHPSVPRE